MSDKAILSQELRDGVARIIQEAPPSAWKRALRQVGVLHDAMPGALWRTTSGHMLEYALPIFLATHGHPVVRKEASAEYKDLIYNGAPLELKTHLRGVWDSVRVLPIYESLGTPDDKLDTPHLVLKKRKDALGFVEVEFKYLWEFLGLNDAGELHVHRKNGFYQNVRPVIAKEKRFKTKEEAEAAVRAFVEAHPGELRV